MSEAISRAKGNERPEESSRTSERSEENEEHPALSPQVAHLLAPVMQVEDGRQSSEFVGSLRIRNTVALSDLPRRP